MSKFATSFISFFDNVTRMQVIEAETPLDAMKGTLVKLGFVTEFSDLAEFTTEEELKVFCFNSDALVEALEI